MKVTNVDKTNAVARVQIEMDTTELFALAQAVRDNDLYKDDWSVAIAGSLHADFFDVIKALLAVPKGCVSKIVG